MKGDKVYQIITEEFDGRVGLSVIQYLCEQVGIDNAREITDEEIDAIEGNAFMSQRFCQAMVRCARRIARECTFIGDIIPYILNNYDHLSGHVTQRRTNEILERFVDYFDAPADAAWALRNVCGCGNKELEDLGFGYLTDENEEEGA